MEIPDHSRKFIFYSLLTFFAISTASIALQNLIWIPVFYLGWLYFKNHPKTTWHPFVVWTLLWVLSFYLGAFLGVNPLHSFETVHRYLTILLVLFVGAMGMGSLEIRKFLNAFTWGTVFCAVYGIAKHLFLHQGRIDSFSGDKMVFGGLLMTALVIQFGFLMRKPKDPLLWAGAFLNGWALILTETRGAWVGLFAGFLMLGWRFNRKWILASLLLAVAGYFALPANIQERVVSIVQLNIQYDKKHEINFSTQARILIWAAGIKMIRDYPLGIGQGNVGEIYPRYRLEALGQYEATEPHLHDNFLQITVQNGWQGLGIYAGWIFCLFLRAFKFKGEDPLGRDLNWIMTSCFLASLVWGLTEFTFAQQFMYLQYSMLGLQWGLWERETSSTA